MKAHKNIIFDLIGVLFAIDQYAILRHMGVARVLRYMLTHHKNPFSCAYAVLNHMATQEEHNDRVIHYKKARLPRCIAEWQEGKKTNRQALQEVSQFLYTPQGSSFFQSNYEQQTVNHIITTIFNASCLTNYMRPVIPNLFLVKDLKQFTPYRLFLLSNFDVDAMATLSLSYPEFFSLFDGVVVSGQVGLLKPYPEIYQHLLDAYDLRAEESLFIDDQPENIMGAQQVGISCVLYKNPRQLHKSLNELNIL